MGGLTDEQLHRFGEDGYLVVEDLLGEADLAGVEAEYRRALDRAAAGLVADGRLKPLRGDTFSDRYIEAVEQLDDMYALYQHLDISLPMVADLDWSHTLHTGPAVFGLLTHPRLLDVVESVIGPEIFANPVQHARIKPPRRRLPDIATDANIAATMWHQDSAVTNPEADETDMLTVWLAVTDATVENGCLIAERGSHLDELALHCPGKHFSGEIYIPESLIDADRVVPLEVRAGSAVLLHKLTSHGSLDNDSDAIRWSFDLRYQPVGQPTGRSLFPGFIARSAAHPESAVTDAAEWTRLWRQAQGRIVNGEVEAKFNARWDSYASHTLCA